MKRASYSVLFVLSLAGAFLAGSCYNLRARPAAASTPSRRILRYACPMHPQFTSATPGNAPCCGMRLEPVYAAGEPATETGAGMPGAVAVSAEKQQLIGVQVAAVERSRATAALRLLGRVAADETRIYRAVAGADGFFRQVSAVTTGSLVEKDQWLATFSAPEVRSPLQGFLVTLDQLDRQSKDRMNAAQIKAAAESCQLAIDRLLNAGLSAPQIEEIRRTRELPPDFKILAPSAGFVLARNASPGQKFSRGEEWYRIADLSRVWVLADVFEDQAQYVRPGMRARVSLSRQRMNLQATVSEVLPRFDPNTQTLKVRLEADNPGFVLRPDMIADIELPVALPPAVTVPVDAVLDSGLRKTVYVEHAKGVFEPRAVETGWRFDEKVEIIGGLHPGERIVVRGNFLLDSESRMRLTAVTAARQIPDSITDPVCGMEVHPASDVHGVRWSGRRYSFCSDQCRREFQANPARYGDGETQHRVRSTLAQPLHEPK